MENRAPRRMTIGDLRHWHVVSAWCDRCKKRKVLDLSGYKPTIELRKIEGRLRCRGCRREGAYIVIENAPR